MQVKNTSPGTITIAGVHHIPAGEVRSFEDDLWATLRKRPAVVQWIAEGKLSDLGDRVVAEIGGVTVAATKIDPLDHDGDGKKGGSLPKAQRKAKA